MSNPWRSLEEMRGFSGVAAEWRQHMGMEFALFREGFLDKAERPASSYPCPRKMGCVHQVKPRGNGFLGVCKDDDGTGCDDLLLTAEDVAVWQLNRSRLGLAIAWAFESEPIELRLTVPHTMQVASYGSAATPVLLTLPQRRDEFQQAVTVLVAQSRHPFILFGATNRFVDDRCLELLEKRNAAYFDLASHVELKSDGKLEAQRPAREVFAKFFPQRTRTAAQPASVATININGRDHKLYRVCLWPLRLTLLSKSIDVRFKSDAFQSEGFDTIATQRKTLAPLFEAGGATLNGLKEKPDKREVGIELGSMLKATLAFPNREPWNVFCRVRPHTPEEEEIIFQENMREGARGQGTANTDRESNEPALEKIIAQGRLRYRPGFEDVWVGDAHYDLRTREKARFCIEYLVEQKAFAKGTGKHLGTEIDPFVRSKCGLPAAPHSEVKIHHYFTDRARKLQKLRKALIHAAGRNGRFYLKVE